MLSLSRSLQIHYAATAISFYKAEYQCHSCLGNDDLYKLNFCFTFISMHKNKPYALTLLVTNNGQSGTADRRLNTHTEQWCTIHCTDCKSNRNKCLQLKDQISSKVEKWQKLVECQALCHFFIYQKSFYQYSSNSFDSLLAQLLYYIFYILMEIEISKMPISSGAFSALMLMVGRQNVIQPVKTECWDSGMVICLEWGADVHMAKLMPLPLTISCSSKSRLVLPSWFYLSSTS